MHARDVTSAWACFGLWGPRARDVLAPLTDADLGNDAFPYLTARNISIGAVPVIAVRVTYVGELGWELYCPTEYGLTLWDTLWDAGAAHGMVAGGYRAIDALRVEKGYRVWGADITPEDNPYEAGLGFAVRLDKPAPFVGRDALRAAKADGRRAPAARHRARRSARGRARLRAGAGRRRDRRPGDERRLRLPGRRVDRIRVRARRPRRRSAARSRSRCSASGSPARSCAIRCTTRPEPGFAPRNPVGSPPIRYDVGVGPVELRAISNGLVGGCTAPFPITMLLTGLVLPSDWNAKVIDGAQCVRKSTPSIKP